VGGSPCRGENLAVRQHVAGIACENFQMNIFARRQSRRIVPDADLLAQEVDRLGADWNTGSDPWSRNRWRMAGLWNPSMYLAMAGRPVLPGEEPAPAAADRTHTETKHISEFANSGSASAAP
jgi:hypothetical protein